MKIPFRWCFKLRISFRVKHSSSILKSWTEHSISELLSKIKWRYVYLLRKILKTLHFSIHKCKSVKILLLYAVHVTYPDRIRAKCEEDSETQCEDDRYLTSCRKTSIFLLFFSLIQKCFNNCFTSCRKDLYALPLKSKNVTMFHCKWYESSIAFDLFLIKQIVLLLGREYALLFLAQVLCTPWVVWQMQTWTVGN